MGVEVDVVCFSYLWKVKSKASSLFLRRKGVTICVRDVNTCHCSLPMVPRFYCGSCVCCCYCLLLLYMGLE